MSELKITYVDEARNQFVDLGAVGGVFDDIPQANYESDFMVDVHDETGLVGGKCIAQATAETLLGREIDLERECIAAQAQEQTAIAAWNQRKDKDDG